MKHITDTAGIADRFVPPKDYPAIAIKVNCTLNHTQILNLNINANEKTLLLKNRTVRTVILLAQKASVFKDAKNCHVWHNIPSNTSIVKPHFLTGNFTRHSTGKGPSPRNKLGFRLLKELLEKGTGIDRKRHTWSIPGFIPFSKTPAPI